MSIKTKILRQLEQQPCTRAALKARLGNDKKVVKALAQLCEKNKVLCREGVYALCTERAQHAVPCTLVKLARGFGFARPASGGPDVFIPGRFLRGAMPGDEVLVSLFGHPQKEGSAEGEVLAVTKEQNRFAGTVERREGRLVFLPDVCPALCLVLKKGLDGGAREGEKVAVELLERGGTHEAHRAGVAMRFGSAQSARACAKAILYEADIETHFSTKAKDEAKALAAAGISEQELHGRLDLRGEAVFTIDSADTKDIDDAVSIARRPGGFSLGVHIADVSHYVKPGTALEEAAFSRGTSVYYADKVVPMLPRALSNGICSLNEGEDRLCFSCLMELSEAGEVQSFRFVKSVIRSRVKGVYGEINEVLAGEAAPGLVEKYAPVRGQLAALELLYRALAARRAARGAMELDTPEAKLSVNTEGVCVGVARRSRGLAERIIEECMLCANTCAARCAREAGVPCVYRVHEAPSPQKAQELRETLAALSVPHHFAHTVPAAQELADLLARTRGTPLAACVHMSVLRAMSKAVYSPRPQGHFALCLADYAHFTSPIRRYPDICVHRALSALCAGEKPEKGAVQAAERAAQRASGREQAAAAAERDIEEGYKAEYMRGFLGEGFAGVITGVTSFGIYVQLENTVEGLVRAGELSRGRLVLSKNAALADETGGKSWRVGDAVRVKLLAADVASGNIDFALA